MKVNSYKYFINPDIKSDGYMTQEHIKLCKDYLKNLKLTGKCAFLYVGGATIPSSETRYVEQFDSNIAVQPIHSSTAIKESSAYCMHKWIGMLSDRDKISFASINANTCASSMYSLYEAQDLFEKGFDEIVIVAEERTSYNTLRVFEESRIDLKLGQGMSIIHLSREGSDITNCKWAYSYDRNPFGVTQEGYSTVFSSCDIVKPHGTGTENNESAEQLLTSGRQQLRFKEEIGHCQGASGLIEVCMVLDSDVKGRVLCVSSGLGGFYGSCIVEK
jgi:hypothetical protein